MKIVRKKCIVCEKNMEVRTKKRNGRKMIGVKNNNQLGKNRMTCSRPCSIIYARIITHMSCRLRKQNKNENNIN